MGTTRTTNIATFEAEGDMATTTIATTAGDNAEGFWGNIMEIFD